MAALAAADLVPLDTARGGLLRFILVLTVGVLGIPPSPAFQAGFHIAVGLAMALFYAFALQPVLRGPSWLCTALCDGRMARERADRAADNWRGVRW
jgi:hypothetical protein